MRRWVRSIVLAGIAIGAMGLFGMNEARADHRGCYRGGYYGGGYYGGPRYSYYGSPYYYRPARVAYYGPYGYGGYGGPYRYGGYYNRPYGAVQFYYGW